MFIGNKNFFKLIYLGLCLIAVFAFTYGYIYTTSKIKSNNIATEMGSYEGSNEVYDYNNDYVQNALTQDTISQDAVLSMKTHYKQCGHTINENIKVPQDIAALTEKQFKIAYKDWNIEKFSSDEIIISRVLQEKCPEHYIVKERNGKVAVYYQRPINGISLKELTNILVVNLSRVDQIKLKEGIIINSNEKLAELLEDFGS